MNCAVESIVDRLYAVVEYTRTYLCFWSYETNIKAPSGESTFRQYYGSANSGLRSRFYAPPASDWVIDVREDKGENESWKN